MRKVLLVDADRAVRERFRDLLSEAFPRLELICGTNYDEAVNWVGRRSFDLVLLSDRVCETGFCLERVCARAQSATPNCLLVLLADTVEPARLFAGITAGARGYLLKSMRDVALIEEFQSIVHGRLPVAPDALQVLMDLVAAGFSVEVGPSTAAGPSVDVGKPRSSKQITVQRHVATPGPSARAHAELQPQLSGQATGQENAATTVKSVGPMQPGVSLRAATLPSAHLHSEIVTPGFGGRVDVHLTSRETEILHLAAKGFSRPEIAGMLSISKHTVATHLTKVYDKCDISSRSEATLVARSLGLV